MTPLTKTCVPLAKGSSANRTCGGSQIDHARRSLLTCEHGESKIYQAGAGDAVGWVPSITFDLLSACVAKVRSADVEARQIRHATWSGTIRRPRLTLERTKCFHAQHMALLPRRVSHLSLRAAAVSERRCARHALKDVATRFELRREHSRRRRGAAALLAFAAAQWHHKPHAVCSTSFWLRRTRNSLVRVGCPSSESSPDCISTASWTSRQW